MDRETRKNHSVGVFRIQLQPEGGKEATDKARRVNENGDNEDRSMRIFICIASFAIDRVTGKQNGVSGIWRTSPVVFCTVTLMSL